MSLPTASPIAPSNNRTIFFCISQESKNNAAAIFVPPKSIPITAIMLLMYDLRYFKDIEYFSNEQKKKRHKTTKPQHYPLGFYIKAKL
jgi:hypothetical protein